MRETPRRAPPYLPLLLLFFAAGFIFFGSGSASASDGLSALPAEGADDRRLPRFHLSAERWTVVAASDFQPGLISGGETLFSRAYGRRLMEDAGHVLSAPARWERRDWLIFSLEAAGVAAVSRFDRPIQKRLQRNRDGIADDIARIAEPFGAEYSFIVLGGFYLTGALADRPKPKEVALDGLAASFIASVIVTPTIKIVVGRDRPAQSERVDDVHPFRFFGDNSFPSGHATQAFAAASAIATHYDSIWINAAAYGVAALAGFARVQHNAHFASDVVAGALIGTAVGRATVHYNEASRGLLSFGPQIDPDRRGWALTLHF